MEKYLFFTAVFSGRLVPCACALPYKKRKTYRSSALTILIMGVSTELWRLHIGCFTMPRKCKTLKPRHLFSINLPARCGMNRI